MPIFASNNMPCGTKWYSYERNKVRYKFVFAIRINNHKSFMAHQTISFFLLRDHTLI